MVVTLPGMTTLSGRLSYSTCQKAPFPMKVIPSAMMMFFSNSIYLNAYGPMPITGSPHTLAGMTAKAVPLI